MPATSGASGPTTTRSMASCRQKRDHGGMIGRIERRQFGVFGDAGIARGGGEPGQKRRLGELPRQRVFAPARADEKDVHFGFARPVWPGD